MATGQYLTDVAVRLVERGHQVTVITGRRAYDQPQTQFPKQETWRGIRVYRVGSTGFGKSAKWRRAADFASFLALASLRLARLPRTDVVVALTSPPLISLLGAGLARLRRSRFFYWVMDFNPDEAIAAGWLRPDSRAAKLLDWISRFSLRRAHTIIALDRFMRERIVAKGIAPARVLVIPPWSHDTEVKFDAQGRERFRKTHGLDGKFVVMYSGNHSPCHPLDTLLAAAVRLKEDKSIVFCFVGGGSEWRKIKEQLEQGAVRSLGIEEPSTHNPESSTIRCFPYQPLDELAGSLSAADLHVVVMGNDFVGLVHPCKIYNVLGVAAPVLYIGPRPSHLSEIIDSLIGEYPCASTAHGEVEQVVQAIDRLRRESPMATRLTPPRVRSLCSKEVLLPQLIEAIESR